MDKIKYVMRILFVFVVILFVGNQVDVDSVNKANKEQHHDHEHHHHERDALALNAKKFYAQRNMYLTGSVIFLSLVLDRFYAMVLELIKNEEKAEVLKQQAAKTSKEYLKVMDEMDQMKKLADSAKKLEKELEIVKKQAAQTNDEYMRLTDKLAAYESQEDKKSK